MVNEYQEHNNLEELIASFPKLHKDGLVFSRLMQIVDIANRKYELSPQIAKKLSGLINTKQKFETSILHQLTEPLYNASTQSNALTTFIKTVEAWQKDEKTANRIRYIEILSEIKWPLFLIKDEIFINAILKASAEGADNDHICAIVSEYFIKGFLDQTAERWKNNPVVRNERIPILMEAIEMHKAGNYYSSVSTLMCQVYGVASDIIDAEKQYGLAVSSEQKGKVARAFKMEEKSIDSEKGKIAQSFLFIRHGFFAWQAAIAYLNSEILCSSDSKKRWATQPLRNKICHGDQLNFGSLEHSLKAILVIDMLMEYALEIENTGKRQRGVQGVTNSVE